MSITFVRPASGPGASPVLVSFTENNAGDTLVAYFAVVATTADFDAPPMTLTDSNGSTWSLAYSNINFADALAASFCALAVYINARCANAGTNTLAMPTQMTPGDVLATWANGAEFATTFAAIDFSEVTFETFAGEGGAFPVTQTGSNNLQVAALYDAGLNTSGAGVLNANVSGSHPLGFAEGSTSDSGIYGWGNIEAPTYDGNISLGSGTSTFGFWLTLTGSNATGGSAATTLTFSINKGPEPIVPREGRAIATVQLDCTQQPVVSSVNFPELTVLGDIATPDSPAFVVAQFDLEHLFQGSGLSEVRYIACWARPAFQLNTNGNREDVNAAGNLWVFPALITNTTTLQTLMFGENAAFTQVNSGAAGQPEVGQAGIFGQYSILPFPANKNSLKYRIIVPQFDPANPKGKFIFQFFNWDLTGAIASNAAVLTTTED